MLISEQFPVTDANLLGLNVPEQEDEWEILADDGTYSVQDVVRVGHNLFRALRDHTPASTNSPQREAADVADPLTDDPDPLHWLNIGASNAYRLFDGRPSQKCKHLNEIKAGVKLSDQTGAIGLFGMIHASRVSAHVLTNADKATLAWSSPSISGITKYQYRKRETGESDWGDWTDIAGSGVGSTSAEISDLDPFCGCDFQIRPFTSSGQAGSNTAVLDVRVLMDGETAPDVTASGSSGATITDLVAKQYRIETYEADIDLSNSNEVTDWLSYFTLPIHTRRSTVIDDLPITGLGDVLTVEITGDSLLECGQIVVGTRTADIGTAHAGNTGFESVDFSELETTPYGELVTTPRAATQLYRFEVLLPVSETQRFAELLDSLRGGKLALWVADDATEAHGFIYGYLRTGRVYYVGGQARGRLTVQGVT